MSIISSSLALVLGLSSLSANTPNTAPAAAELPQHVIVERFMLSLAAEGFDGRANLIEKGVKQDASSFITLMTDAYKKLDRKGLPASYPAYMDAIIAWAENDLPLITAEDDDEKDELIFAAYEAKNEQLKKQYPDAYSMLTSEKQQLKNLLQRTGLEQASKQFITDNIEQQRENPRKMLVAHFRFVAQSIRDYLAQGAQ